MHKGTVQRPYTIMSQDFHRRRELNANFLVKMKLCWQHFTCSLTFLHRATVCIKCSEQMQSPWSASYPQCPRDNIIYTGQKAHTARFALLLLLKQKDCILYKAWKFKSWFLDQQQWCQGGTVKIMWISHSDLNQVHRKVLLQRAPDKRSIQIR